MRSVEIDNASTNEFPSRALNGALNGNIGVLKSILAEMTGPSALPLVFSCQSLAYAAGATVG